MFAESPAIAGLLSNPEPGRVNRNTMLSRRFAGGSLKVVSAKAPRNLRALTVRILAIDEADGMESGSEGSPIALAERRTQTFPNPIKIVDRALYFEFRDRAVATWRALTGDTEIAA